MDFALNDEQQMLHEAATRFFADHHPPVRARRALRWRDPAQQALWSDMAGMGWLALRVPETHDGLGLGMTEACIVAEAAGQRLLNLPLAASAVLLPAWLAAFGEKTAPALLRDWVRAAMAGERAFHCSAEDAAWIDHADQASDHVVVQGWHDDTVPLRVALRTLPVQAGPGEAFDATLRQGPAGAAGQPLDWVTLDIAPEARARARAAHRLALAAELVGTAQAGLDLGSAHARERVQFGRPIGSYQAVKHQLANVWMGVDNARLAVRYAAAALDGGLPDWRFACAAAEFTAIEGAQQATRTAIQVHGGMGFTWEHDAHLYLKRAQHLATRLGGASHALDTLEALALS